MDSLGHYTNVDDVYLDLEFGTVGEGQHLVVTFCRCKNGIIEVRGR